MGVYLQGIIDPELLLEYQFEHLNLIWHCSTSHSLMLNVENGDNIFNKEFPIPSYEVA